MLATPHVVATHEPEGRARHSVRAALEPPSGVAQEVTRPTKFMAPVRAPSEKRPFMKSSLTIPFLLLALVLCPAGCTKKENTAGSYLQKSFAAADPAVRDIVEKASAALQRSNYTEAVVMMYQLAEGHQISATEKKAIGMVLAEINQGLAANPGLETPDLYRARAALIEKVHGHP